jgi:hypothetical protein
MEPVFDRKAVHAEVSSERFTKGGRTTKPNTRLAQFRYGLANAFARQSSIAGVDENVQADSR